MPVEFLRVAIQGCCHGELDSIYNAIEERAGNKPVDLLIICGDFQAIRNKNDLAQMSCPDKYKKIGYFHEYYSGKKLAPVPTIFIGGNHEASNYMWELFYGGWVCPNIYYLGCAGVVNFGGLRIGGLSGIYNKHNYHRGFDEVQPLTGSDIKSIYHIRRMSVYKMELIQKPIDIFLTHDWPRDIVAHGDKQKLLKSKKFLAREIEQKSLGSPPAEILLKKLKPSYWFSAHMHTKFEATVHHGQPINQNPDQILIEDSDMENSDENFQQKGENSNKRKRSNSPKLDEPLITKFLALDKCLPNRNFLEILEIPVNERADKFLTLDREWLGILKATHEYQTFGYYQGQLPDQVVIDKKIDQALKYVNEKISDEMLTPPYFIQTAPEHQNPKLNSTKFEVFSNPQTEEICSLLEIDCRINPDGTRINRPKVETLQEAKERLLSMLNQ